jgi:hypothetical protein
MPLLQLSENQDAHVLSQSFLVDGREIEVFQAPRHHQLQ